jgi:hypothetical protein
VAYCSSLQLTSVLAYQRDLLGNSRVLILLINSKDAKS